MSDEPAEVSYQSLYRRYRPQRFSEVRGQDHVTTALRNAVRQERVAHAYLFSGPRGTGKTSTARILAMALDCEHPVDGEPDGTCPSCVAIRRGSSMDVQELDAASNRKLDEMRDLLSRVSLGTGGRWKVYIIDEVHQLTPDAASALLKTLEEPPAHVVFVLATTDPQKVLPTIRSRTQHYEFRLLSADTLGGLLNDVNQAAGLGVAPEAIDLVVRRGHGSARDALSVLDQVAAAGEAEDESSAVTDIVEGLADRDAGRVLIAVAEGMAAGREPRRLATDLLEHLRNGFLALTARGLVHLPDDAAAVVEGQARRMGLAGTVRALEAIGQAAADMRDSVDPRVTLEVALVRVAAPAADTDVAALAARLERLEAAIAHGAPSAPAPELPIARTGGRPQQPAAPEAPAGPAVPPSRPDPAARMQDGPARLEGPPTGPADPAPPPPGQPGTLPGQAVGPGQDVGTGQDVASGQDIGARPRPSGRPPRTDRPARRDEPRPTLGAPPPAPRPGPPGPPAPGGGRPSPPGPASPSPRPTIGAHRRGGDVVPGPQAKAPPVPPGPSGTARPRPEPAAPANLGGPLPTRDQLTKAWGDTVLPALPARVKAYLSQGRFVAVEDAVAVFALPDQGLLSRAAAVQGDAEAALAAHFARPVPLRLVLDDGAAPARPDGPPPEPQGSADDDFSSYDIDDLEDAGPGVVSPEQRLLEAFPGAEEVTQ
ncbi:DNA polymerase III subunit gamma/tau [Acidiferrimicrobium sp. IK]|uniref:DNA polymerase III subunit gamma/tau n=1 Tax=Acidiferrimicrobium sp. IK TaxID=2871700 RepID=UPI0021CB0509|nr:DNA polymerase III subunit gamma/tau [Acidiferrimicrobium sp. IK]MCU4186149.1 DNA polymerase III subunit gamma/tau [Acidiferrimicrobium sp. IK]